MKISELIDNLQELEKLHGNLEVVYDDFDRLGGISVKKVKVVKAQQDSLGKFKTGENLVMLGYFDLP